MTLPGCVKCGCTRMIPSTFGADAYCQVAVETRPGSEARTTISLYCDEAPTAICELCRRVLCGKHQAVARAVPTCARCARDLVPMAPDRGFLHWHCEVCNLPHYQTPGCPAESRSAP